MDSKPIRRVSTRPRYFKFLMVALLLGGTAFAYAGVNWVYNALHVTSGVDVNITMPDHDQAGLTVDVTTLTFSISKLAGDAGTSPQKSILLSNVGDTNKPIYIHNDLPAHFTLNIFLADGVTPYVQGTVLNHGASEVLRLSVMADSSVTTSGLRAFQITINYTP